MNKSTKVKIAENILGTFQAISYVFALLFFIQLLTEFMKNIGVHSDSVGAYSWGIIIGLMVLIGWAIEASGKFKN